MATKRGGERAHLIELRDRNAESRLPPSNPPKRPHFKRDIVPSIERTVLQTDTIQGLALLYNTTVSEIKKLNQLQTDAELHARRVILVPSRGILINLEAEPVPVHTTNRKGMSSVDGLLCDDNDNLESEIPKDYLNTKDSLLTELRTKAEHIVANSPILSLEGDQSAIPDYIGNFGMRKEETSIKWWHIFLPCVSFVILFPILVFVFQDHLNHLSHDHLSESTLSAVRPNVNSNILEESELVLPEN